MIKSLCQYQWPWHRPTTMLTLEHRSNENEYVPSALKCNTVKRKLYYIQNWSGINLSEFLKCLSDIFLSSVWVRLCIFSQLSIIQYMELGVFGLPISLVMIETIYTLSYYNHQMGSMNYIPVTGSEILNCSRVYWNVITSCFIAEINIVQYINICDGL